MLPLLASLVLLQGAPIERDDYGVPHIQAASLEQAFFQAGYAVAQDRLWQMENSRRVARGKMAEAFGSAFVASDREILGQAYTDEELEAQYQALSPRAKITIDNYVKGVNAYIDEAKRNGSLPTGYKENDLAPEPWTRLDTVAITIRLFQQFGKGGAGEIRNLALLGYLQSRKELDGKVLDVLDDFAWQNDKTATCTISDVDDPLKKTHPEFPVPSRAVTEKHVASLPKVSLFELLPGLRLVERQESTKVAEQVSAPYKWGSYCMVVSPALSGSGYPLLLSAPQMGFRTPSIVHEMSIEAPGLSVVGMDVPGVPGVAIGHNGFLAWGLTSGVADTDDIFYNSCDESSYRVGGTQKPFSIVSFELKVKGGAAQKIAQKRTEWGPVVVESKSSKVAFSRHSASRMKEMQSFECIVGMDAASSVADVENAIRPASVNFNCFYATRTGEIGYRYTGAIPMRSANFDPRFPVPGEPNAVWKGLVPFESMPHVQNPRSGLLVNWNNKPVSWWTNADTPVWGEIFRNTEILHALAKPKLAASDLELAAWTIARRDETWPYFKPFVKDGLGAFEGWMLDGSREAKLYQLFFDALREQLFLTTTGNFISMDNFKLVAQPSVMLRALQGKTKVKYFQGRKPEELIAAALAKARSEFKTPYSAPGIPVLGQPPIPYSNRGTYIQVVEFLKDGPQGRDVVTPGVSETGAHALDQVPLARAWLFKPMRFRGQ